jgi:hypothetical protein
MTGHAEVPARSRAVPPEGDVRFGGHWRTSGIGRLRRRMTAAEWADSADNSSGFGETPHSLPSNWFSKDDDYVDNCWDNACVESFFGTLKRELLHRRSWATRHEAAAAIHEYIEVFYNRRRLHSTLGYKAPAVYEGLYEMQETQAA